MKSKCFDRLTLAAYHCITWRHVAIAVTIAAIAFAIGEVNVQLNALLKMWFRSITT
jgi:hypothetical protein